MKNWPRASEQAIGYEATSGMKEKGKLNDRQGAQRSRLRRLATDEAVLYNVNASALEFLILVIITY
jgi:hypothetical protein